jgi:hypothetical protein
VIWPAYPLPRCCGLSRRRCRARSTSTLVAAHRAGRFFLRPDRETNDAFISCMELATRKGNVSVACAGSTSNHDHAVVVDDHGRLPEVLEHLLRTQLRWGLTWLQPGTAQPRSRSQSARRMVGGIARELGRCSRRQGRCAPDGTSSSARNQAEREGEAGAAGVDGFLPGVAALQVGDVVFELDGGEMSPERSPTCSRAWVAATPRSEDAEPVVNGDPRRWQRDRSRGSSRTHLGSRGLRPRWDRTAAMSPR